MAFERPIPRGPVLLGPSHRLRSGLTVRLRIARAREVDDVRRLLKRNGFDPSAAPALLRFDPRHRIVVSACTLLGSTETTVGIGAIDRDADEPDLVIVDSAVGPDLEELLSRALRNRTAVLRTRAA